MLFRSPSPLRGSLSREEFIRFAETYGGAPVVIVVLTDTADAENFRKANLESASAAHQFELHYQPQLDLHTGRVYGAEALLRWNHPQLGLLTPADFLDVLLESSAYEATGDWLIRLAFRQAAKWQAENSIPFKVAVNLSATTIQNCDLAALVAEAAEAACVCPSALDIEVTENVVMSDFAAASRALSEVRRLGVTV